MVPEPKKKSQSLVLYIAMVALILVLDASFMFFTRNEARTTVLLKKELTSLEQEDRIIASANEISRTYQSEIDLISGVFPNGTTIPVFIQTLESTIRSYADEYTVKFNAVTPLKEQDKLFLPLSISLKTDVVRFNDFLAALEKLPYLTHVTAISSKSSEGFTKASEIQVNLKVYVQNPFSTN